MQQQRKPVDMTGVQRQSPAGIFDKRPSETVVGSVIPSAVPKDQPQPSPVQNRPLEPKPDFPDVFKEQEKMIQNVRESAPKQNQEESEIEKLNQSLSGELKPLDEDIIKISPEDMKVAEQLIFNGYAETNIELPNFKDHFVTICSTNAEEHGMIDDIVFEKLRSSKQNADGTVELPENAVRSLRKALFVAVSFRGIDGNDIAKADAVCHLNTIKRAIIKLSEIYSAGEIPKGDEFKNEIKKAMLKRASMVRRQPTPIIDFITGKKYEFDVKMLRIMNEKNIIPLS